MPSDRVLVRKGSQVALLPSGVASLATCQLLGINVAVDMWEICKQVFCYFIDCTIMGWPSVFPATGASGVGMNYHSYHVGDTFKLGNCNTRYTL